MSWTRWRSGRFFGKSRSKVLGIGWIFALNSALGRWTGVDAQFCSTRRLRSDRCLGSGMRRSQTAMAGWDVLLQEVFFRGGNLVGIVCWWEVGLWGLLRCFFHIHKPDWSRFFSPCVDVRSKFWSTIMRERTFLVRQKVNTSQMGHEVHDGNRECLRHADLTDIEIMVDGKYENRSTSGREKVK